MVNSAPCYSHQRPALQDDSVLRTVLVLDNWLPSREPSSFVTRLGNLRVKDASRRNLRRAVESREREAYLALSVSDPSFRIKIGPRTAQPAAIGRPIVKRLPHRARHSARQHAGDAALHGGILHDQLHALSLSDQPHDLDVERWNRLKLPRPVLRIVRPMQAR